MIPVLLVLLAACAPKGLTLERGPRSPVSPATVAVAPAALLRDIPGAVRDDAFLEGMYVGNVVMAGGYVVEETPRGMQARSKDINLVAAEGYAAQATQWADGAVWDLRPARGATWVPAPDLVPELLPAPRRTDARGTGREDGTDNQNLPRFSLSPAPLSEDALRRVPAGADTLLVPLVVHYYSHNGGWFLGQTYGSGSGARVRLLWTLYDARSGAPLTWADIGATHVQADQFTPNSAQVEDYLIKAEGAVLRGLRRTLR